MIPGLKKRTFTFHDVLMYLAIAYVHLRLIALVLCFSLLAGLTYYVYAKPVYYSKALVRVDILDLPVEADQTFHDGTIFAIVNQLDSRYLVENTAKYFGINDGYKNIFLKHIKKIRIDRSYTNDLTIEAWTYSLNLAHNWGDVLVQQFLKVRDEQRKRYNETLITSFKREVSDLGAQIESDFAQKFDFKTQKGATEAFIELERIKELPQKLAKLKQQIEIMSRAKIDLVDPNLTTVARLSLIAGVEAENHKREQSFQISMGQVIDSNSNEDSDSNTPKAVDKSSGVVVMPSILNPEPEHPWQSLEIQQQKVQREINDAASIYMPGNPKMQALEKELDEVNKGLDLEYQVAKSRFDLEYQDLQNKQHDLEAKLPSYQEIIRKYEKIAQDFKLQQAGHLAWDNLYTKASKKISAVEFGGEKERANLQFLGITESSDDPVFPTWRKFFALSLAGGIVLSFALVFLIEFLDHTVSNIEEMESTFQIRGLGIIPQIEGVEAQYPLLLGAQNGEEKNLLENFRVIRTNLLSMGSMSKPPHVIMITSAMPKEGKTVIASNLALSFAQMGVKTLLIDADLRRGRLHRLFGLRKGPGLGNLLLEKADLEEVLRPSGKENLTVLTAGQHIDGGTELLGSARFTELMNEFRGRFDRILIDTPPVLGLSETSILQNYVDGVLFVVWGGHTPIRSMKTAVESLQANGANFYGFILNRLDLSATTNYYQYYYYSNDYYHNYHVLENA